MSATHPPNIQGTNIYREYPRLKGETLRVSAADPFSPKAFVITHLTKPGVATPSSAPTSSVPLTAADKGAAEHTYNTRVAGKNILLVNPQKESRLTKLAKDKAARRQKHKDRKKLQLISRKEAKCKGVWRLDPKDAKWETFLDLHRLWLGYMSELCALPPRPKTSPGDPAYPQPTIQNAAMMQAKLVKADFHGSIITVKDAKNKCLVGCEGIVFHETEGTFKVITKENKTKIIPKQNSIFTFHLPAYDYRTYPPPPPKVADKSEVAPGPAMANPPAATKHPLEAALAGMTTDPLIQFELYGNQFCFRSGERTSKKFKAKSTIELL